MLDQRNSTPTYPRPLYRYNLRKHLDCHKRWARPEFENLDFFPKLKLSLS
jgi:hypothetical protein